MATTASHAPVHHDDPAPVPVIDPKHTLASVTDTIGEISDTKPLPLPLWIWFGIGFVFLNIMVISIAHLFNWGMGISAVNNRVGWGFYIINFVWWIGIGHAGTLISAVLLLFKQQWRTSINRFAEAMTIFAVMCAGMFPILHTGRQWLAYWLLPYPNSMGMWPNFRSPLLFDVFAVSTYATVSILFWYVGLIPDIATLRDRARSALATKVYGVLSLGWRGAATHWNHYETASLILAGLATPLVVSVHTIVSYDFALSNVPGWHATVFPPYFVAGAVYAGFAMVLTICIPIRKLYKLESLITDRHLDNMSKIMLSTGLVVFYGYLIELFFQWYSGTPAEMHVLRNRLFGPYNWSFWALMFCNGLAPQILWIKSVRTNTTILWLLSLVIGVGMWLERFVIVVVSLQENHMPTMWGSFRGTFWDWSLYLGTMGFFSVLMVLFIRTLPIISIFEVKTLVPAAHPKAGHGVGEGH